MWASARLEKNSVIAQRNAQNSPHRGTNPGLAWPPRSRKRRPPAGGRGERLRGRKIPPPRGKISHPQPRREKSGAGIWLGNRKGRSDPREPVRCLVVGPARRVKRERDRGKRSGRVQSWTNSTGCKLFTPTQEKKGCRNSCCHVSD